MEAKLIIDMHEISSKMIKISMFLRIKPVSFFFGFQNLSFNFLKILAHCYFSGFGNKNLHSLNLHASDNTTCERFHTLIMSLSFLHFEVQACASAIIVNLNKNKYWLLFITSLKAFKNNCILLWILILIEESVKKIPM